MIDPVWPIIIPGVDVSLARVADLKLAKGGAALETELQRPRRSLRWSSIRFRRVSRKQFHDITNDNLSR